MEDKKDYDVAEGNNWKRFGLKVIRMKDGKNYMKVNSRVQLFQLWLYSNVISKQLI